MKINNHAENATQRLLYFIKMTMILASKIISMAREKYRVLLPGQHDFFYRIIDVERNQKMTRYKIQCVNTRNVFKMSTKELVSDVEILYRLHPIQACYVGVAYTNDPCTGTGTQRLQQRRLIKMKGIYSLKYQNREGDVCFVDLRSGSEYLTNPEDIASSKELIEKFDSQQAFHIGVMVGRRAQCFIPKKMLRSRKPFLRVVK